MLRRITAYVGRHHIALLALFFALGGTAFAAGNALLPKNSVGTAQLKKGAVTKQKIAGKTLAQLKGNKGAQGAPGAAGPQGPAGPQGVQGPQGAPGQATAYALVLGDGSVQAANSKGITQAMVTHPATGVYCFNALGFTPKSMVASGDNIGPVFDTIALVGINGTGGGTFVAPNCAGLQARVATFSAAGAGAVSNARFYVWFEG
jgi:hypothetical protein